MEFAGGGSLAELLGEGDGLPETTVLEIVRQVATALGVLHDLQPSVLHRDLKPSNVLVRRREPLDLALADFGIATSLDDPTSRMTGAHRTLFYASPEAMKEEFNSSGELQATASRESDWWSAGIMTVELLTGRRPFKNWSALRWIASLQEKTPVDLQPIWSVPKWRAPLDWARLCRGLLQYERKDRWQAAEVRRWLAGEAVPLPAASESWLRTGEWTVAVVEDAEARASFPYKIGTDKCWTLHELGLALARYWEAPTDNATKRYNQEHDKNGIRRWLDHQLHDHNALARFDDLSDQKDLEDSQRLGRFLSLVLPVSEAATSNDETRKICLQAYAEMPDAQLAMARLLIDGTLQPTDLARAIQLATAAQSADVPEAAGFLADLKHYQDLLRDAEGGDASAQREVGLALDFGKYGLRVNFEQALDWYSKAVKQNDASAKNHLGQMYWEGLGGLEVNQAETLRLWTEAAEQGFAEAQYNLAFILLYGHGVFRDNKAALQWFVKAARQGDARAPIDVGILSFDDLVQYSKSAVGEEWAKEALGDAYPEGESIEAIDTAAARWILRAAERGNHHAQFAIAERYFRGDGVAKDDMVAVRWFMQAANQGNTNAHFTMGQFWRHSPGPLGPEERTKNAIDWLTPPAKHGHTDAMAELGELYLSDQNDAVQAAHWFDLAARQGHPKARLAMARLLRDGLGVTKDVDAAFAMFLKAAEKGDDEAQWEVSEMCLNGTGTSQNLDEARGWLCKASNQNYPKAQLAQARLWADGTFGTFDDEQAIRLATSAHAAGIPEAAVFLDSLRRYKAVRAAAVAGDAASQHALSQFYLNGEIVHQDSKKALYWLRRAADGGDASAKADLGRAFLEGLYDLVIDFSQALRWFRAAAAQGHAEGKIGVGWIYRYGLGVEEDFEEAVRWWTEVAHQGIWLAQRLLAEMLHNGLGVEEDRVAAFSWFLKAAKQGDAESQWQVGRMSYLGLGTPVDYKEAFVWSCKAAEQNHSIAQCFLGFLFRDGQGTSKNPEAGASWLLKAAEQNVPLAQVAIAKCYRDGIGVPRDEALSAHWSQQAQNNGATDAQ